MPVPESIRKVKRPVNTCVEDTGRDTVHRYRVRCRKGVLHVQGGNPRPINGEVVGYIFNGAFVEKKPDSPKPSQAECGADMPDMLSYGSVRLAYDLTRDIFEDLVDVFPLEDACRILVVAILRVIRPGIPDSRIRKEYERTFLLRYYPGLALGGKTIGALLERIGTDGERRLSFFNRRMASVSEGHHVLIDGMLKQDTSEVNSLSAYSRKSRVKGCRDISILYAYDVELGEPLCAQVFPGNCIDASAYADFLRDNKITKGILINDKGFPVKMIEKILETYAELYFITPLKRNDRRIIGNDMLSFSSVIKVDGVEVLCNKKTIMEGKRFLYSFKNIENAYTDDLKYIRKSIKNNSYSTDDYEKRRKSFGVIVFESNCDLDPCVVYRSYRQRWLIELVFKSYKSGLYLDTTREQGDFSVIGSELVNFIATTCTCRILRKAGDAGVMDDRTYHELLDDLRMIWRRSNAPEPPKSDDGAWIHTYKSGLELMEKLGLSEASGQQSDGVPKRKRGRPRKSCAAIA